MRPIRKCCGRYSDGHPKKACASVLGRRLPTTLAGRFDMLMNLFAPMDEDGVRQPEAGLISEDQFRALLGRAS